MRDGNGTVRLRFECSKRARRLGQPSALLCALLCWAYPVFGGGSTPVAPDLITLNAVAYDRHGDPVADLRPDEVFLSDAGKPQQIVSLRLDQTHKHQPIVILFDLLNSRMTGRALVKNEILQSLRRVESSDNLYLYILTKRATLFAIRGLEDYEGPPIPENVP
jgi:hypothetical protein